MTNEEIIRETRNLADKHKYDSVLTFGINYTMAFTDIANHIEEQAKENDKLKAEIEQYKSALTTWNNANNEMLKFNQELKDENEQLKSRNCKSCKNIGVCAINDNFNIDYCSDFEMKSEASE